MSETGGEGRDAVHCIRREPALEDVKSQCSRVREDHARLIVCRESVDRIGQHLVLQPGEDAGVAREGRAVRPEGLRGTAVCVIQL